VNKPKTPWKPKGEMYAIVMEFNGGSRFKAFCEDEKTRMVRIPGRLKKKQWVRVNDLIIIKKWMVEGDKKADLCYRYVKTEREVLLRNNLVPKNMVI
tara:strand:- start:525 stop:815 length:291 start_codon:yes stop_codon:yes gene_type:complete